MPGATRRERITNRVRMNKASTRTDQTQVDIRSEVMIDGTIDATSLQLEGVQALGIANKTASGATEKATTTQETGRTKGRDAITTMYPSKAAHDPNVMIHTAITSVITSVDMLDLRTKASRNVVTKRIPIQDTTSIPGVTTAVQPQLVETRIEGLSVHAMIVIVIVIT